MGNVILAFIYAQLILIPILGIQLLAIRREKQRYKIYAKEVLNHVWRATPNQRR